MSKHTICMLLVILLLILSGVWFVLITTTLDDLPLWFKMATCLFGGVCVKIVWRISENRYKERLRD
jgi:hypothetical protein